MVASLESRYPFVIRRRLYAVLVVVEHWFSDEQIARVNELINANDGGAALEMISDLIVESDARIVRSTFDEIDRLVDTLELPRRLVDQLQPFLR